MHRESDQTDAIENGTIICAGEALIDFISPPSSNWTTIEHFIPRIGGAPANTSVAIRKLGGDSVFLGSLADDQPGDWIRQRLSDEGVDLSRVMNVTGAQTRLAIVTGSIEQRDFVFYGSPAADTLLTPQHVRQSGIEHASAVIAGSLSLLSEPSKSAMEEILACCNAGGTPLVFDPNPRPKSWPDPARARSAMLPFIEHASILKLGAGEPAILGMTIDQIRARQPEHAAFVITDGRNGCWYWYRENRAVPGPPIPVDAIDSTGAGDAFTAALTLRYVQRGCQIEHDDVRFASIVGALTTTSQGAMDALPDRVAVDRLMAQGQEEFRNDTAGE